MGWTTPFAVAKVRSITSGVEVGLNNTTNIASDPVVAPLGKYHCGEVLLWHGASAQPDGPRNACVTATPPLDSRTTSDSHVPEAGVGTVATVCPRAGTETAVATRAPESVTPSMVPDTARAVVLVRITEPGARAPATVVCPVQYHADDSALAAPTSAAGLGGGPPGALFPGARAARASPTNTAATTTSTSQRRPPAWWAGLTPPSVPASGAGRQGPSPARARGRPRTPLPTARRGTVAARAWPSRSWCR